MLRRSFFVYFAYFAGQIFGGAVALPPPNDARDLVYKRAKHAKDAKCCGDPFSCISRISRAKSLAGRLPCLPPTTRVTWCTSARNTRKTQNAAAILFRVFRVFRGPNLWRGGCPASPQRRA